MSASSQFLEMVQEALAPLGQVSVRRMFGGAGIYCNGVMFGLTDDDTLYLKADDTTKSTYEDEGCGPFVYEGKTRPVAMSYWRVPERLYDEPDEFVEWARRALAVAVTTKRPVSPAKAARVTQRTPGSAPSKRQSR